MLTEKEKAQLRPAILKTRDAILKTRQRNLFDDEQPLLDAVMSKLEKIGGMEHPAYLYLESNFHNPDTLDWLQKLMVVKG